MQVKENNEIKYIAGCSDFALERVLKLGPPSWESPEKEEISGKQGGLSLRCGLGWESVFSLRVLGGLYDPVLTN